MGHMEIVVMKIIKYRAENKLSREEMAFRCGISSRYLNNIETMQCSVTCEILDAISAATGIEFMTYTDEELKYYRNTKRPGVPFWKQFDVKP